MEIMKRGHQLLILILSGLILIGLLTLFTFNRLDKARGLWRESLTRQGVYILASFRAMGRAGMRHMQSGSNSRLQYLAEEMAEVGLVKSVYLIDVEGRVVTHSDPSKVDSAEPQAEELWRLALEYQRRLQLGERVQGRFTPGGFLMIRPVANIQPGQGRMGGGQGGRSGPGAWLTERLPLLGVVLLPLDEYSKARQAEIRQSAGLGVGLLGGGLALVALFLFWNDRRLLGHLRTKTGHLMDQMPAGLLAMDQAGRVITANREARAIWGPDSDRLIGLGLEDILEPDFTRAIMNLEPDQTLTRHDAVLIGKDQKISAALSVVRILPTAEDPSGFILLIRDLREVKDLEEALRRSERLAAVGRLSAGVAHEIRNPLSSIRGLAQYLKSKMEDGSDEAGYAEVMIQEADRLNRVVSDLLAYARPRPLERAEADLNGLAGRVVELVREQAAGKGIALDLETAPDLPPLNLDPDQMTQVILNLVLNGLQSGASRVVLSTGLQEGRAVLRVCDDGPGVRSEDRSGIFEPFVTSKAEGSGLGLAISQRIVEEHGGSLELKESDRGAVFEMGLPLG